MFSHRISLVILLLLAGCATASRQEPSLAPRQAESIDPRVPIDPAPAPLGTPDPALVGRLADLEQQAQEEARRFGVLVPQAQSLARGSGPPQSESWIAAQQALTALEGAHGAITAIQTELDALAAERVARGTLVAADQAALEQAMAAVAAISDPQAAVIAEISRRLGS